MYAVIGVTEINDYYGGVENVKCFGVFNTDLEASEHKSNLIIKDVKETENRFNYIKNYVNNLEIPDVKNEEDWKEHIVKRFSLFVSSTYIGITSKENIKGLLQSGLTRNNFHYDFPCLEGYNPPKIENINTSFYLVEIPDVKS